MLKVLLRVLAKLPLRFWHGVGAWGGQLVFYRNARYAQQLRDNLQQSGVASDPAAFDALLRLTVRELGKAAAEIIPIWFRPYSHVLSLVTECRGWEHVDAAVGAGRGVMVITPHLGCFEMVSLYYAARLPMTVMYRPPRQQWAEKLMRAGRARGYVTLATADIRGVRALLRALKRGETVGILPDQVASRGDGVWASFFGRPAYTPTLPSRLYQATGAVPLLMFGERLPDGHGYRIHILPLDIDLSGDKTASTVALNTALETLIRQYPVQYLWSYNRYKRPGGAALPTVGDNTSS